MSAPATVSIPDPNGPSAYSTGLWTRRIGPIAAARRVVLLHGFTQTGTSWFGAATTLAEAGFGALVPDLPGHGGSSDVDADLERSADLVGEVGGRALYVGYSMGGRVALHLALRRPDLVAGLVLIGATGGIEDPRERAERVAADEVLAVALEQDGVAAFLTRWLANPLFAHLPLDRADLAARHSNTVRGLAASLRRCGTGTQRPLWDELKNVACPTLVLAGQYDAKFRTIGQRLADAIGTNAAFDVVADSGHAAQLEQPDRTLVLLRTFLDAS